MAKRPTTTTPEDLARVASRIVEAVTGVHLKPRPPAAEVPTRKRRKRRGTARRRVRARS